jgi:cytochrome c biogenesis protein CcdA
MERAAGICVLVLISAYLWYLVFNKDARRRRYKNAWILRKLNRSQKSAYDSAFVASILLFNLVLSFMLVLVLIDCISEFFVSG